MDSSVTNADFQLVHSLHFEDGVGNEYTVFGGIYNTNREEELSVLVKRLTKDYAISKATKDSIQQLLCINHDNVIGYHHLGIRNATWYLSMDECYWDLEEYLNARLNGSAEIDCDPLCQMKITDLLWQICCGLEYLHDQTIPIIHGNLKPTNVLLLLDQERNRIQAKLVDYGLDFAFHTEEEYETHLGKLTAKDVHDLGNIFELACSSSGDGIVGSEPTLDKLSEEQRHLAKELVAIMVESTDPLQRPSVSLLMCHPFFTRFCPEAQDHLVEKFGPHYLSERTYFDVANVNNWIGLCSAIIDRH